MKNKNIIILTVISIVLLLLLVFGVYALSHDTTANNSSDEINITINKTANDTNQTPARITTKKSAEESEDDGIYFDEELNTYFDKNDRTAYEGQVPKGTSKSQMIEDSEEIIRETNYY